MKLHVKLFAVARQRVGAGAIEVEVPAGSSVRDLRHALVEQHPQLGELARHVRFAVNSDYAGDCQVIAEGAEVAVIPPVSGG